MTQDEIIQMAQTLSDGWWLDDQKLKAFTKLVAAHTLMNIDPNSFMSFQEGVETGRLAERDACAKWYEDKGWLLDESDVAGAIRARGEA